MNYFSKIVSGGCLVWSRELYTRGSPEVFANSKTMEEMVNLIVLFSLVMSHKHCHIKSASSNVPFHLYSPK